MSLKSTLGVIAASLALTVTSLPAQADEVGANIIGGETVSSAPWAAGLYWDDWFGCSATIIAPRWVLTARHCVGELPTHVLVGDVRRQYGTRADVEEALFAPGSRDIALLRLSSEVNTTYMRLASADPPRGSTNWIYGWGTYEVGEGKPASPVLKRGSVRVIDPTTDAYGGPAVGTTKINGTAGYGDSGGPQLYGNVQVGVCSTGDYVTTQYASVAASRSWIRSTAGV